MDMRHQRSIKGSRREAACARSRQQRHRHLELDGSPLLESRFLLANLAMTYIAPVPVQPTDFTAPISLPKFNPALGTLTEVDLSFETNGSQSGTLTNVSTGSESFTFKEDVNLTLTDPSSTLLTSDLVGIQSYTDLAPSASAGFGPFAPSEIHSATYTSGATFDEFGDGPGNVSLSVQTLTEQLTTGGGGNIRSRITTTAGGNVTVTYKYSAAPVNLAGNVYDDLNGTGSLVPGDTPIAGVTLNLVNSAGATIATTTTSADGSYDFSTDNTGAPLLAGTYEIVETQPAGYLQGTNTVGTVDGMTDGALTGVDQIGSIVLTQGQNSVGNNFGEVLPVSLSGVVYNDQTRSGVLEPGDAPIAGVAINLLNTNGLVATTTTNAAGVYQFTNSIFGTPLPPGTYSIVEFQPSGYAQGADNVGTVNGVPVGTIQYIDILGSIILKSGQQSVNNNFGEIAPPLLVTNIQRFGVHNEPTLIVLTFNTPLDPTSAHNILNYKILGPTDSKIPMLIPIESAVYDPATQSVTLHLGQRVQVHHPYSLDVTGLKNIYSEVLTGSNGIAGGTFHSTLNRSDLAGFTDHLGNFVPIDHGKLYPAAIAAGYKGKTFVAPANLGSFASANLAAFVAATSRVSRTLPVIPLLTRALKPNLRTAGVKVAIQTR